MRVQNVQIEPRIEKPWPRSQALLTLQTSEGGATQPGVYFILDSELKLAAAVITCSLSPVPDIRQR